jgi:hypothetical protein
MQMHPIIDGVTITPSDFIRGSCEGVNSVKTSFERQTQKPSKNARESTPSDSIRGSCEGVNLVRGGISLCKGTTGPSGVFRSQQRTQPQFHLETTIRRYNSHSRRWGKAGYQCEGVNRFRASCEGVNRVSAPPEWGSDRATAAEVVRLPPRSPGFLRKTRQERHP